MEGMGMMSASKKDMPAGMMKKKKMMSAKDALDMAKTKMEEKPDSDKVGLVMREFKKGKLHSGGNGKIVKNRRMAIAIALSEGRKHAG